MSERKGFLLRLPPELMEELNRWARDELRSLNAQIEYLLREAVRKNRKNTVSAPASQTMDDRDADAPPKDESGSGDPPASD